MGKTREITHTLSHILPVFSPTLPHFTHTLQIYIIGAIFLTLLTLTLTSTLTPVLTVLLTHRQKIAWSRCNCFFMQMENIVYTKHI